MDRSGLCSEAVEGRGQRHFADSYRSRKQQGGHCQHLFEHCCSSDMESPSDATMQWFPEHGGDQLQFKSPANTRKDMVTAETVYCSTFQT